jgi:PmbA protein
MSEDRLIHQCRQAMKRTQRLGADAAEVYGQTVDSTSSTIEKNDLQISQSRRETAIGIRAFVGDRIGFASTNALEALETACHDAVTLAKASPGDPHNVLPPPGEIQFLDGIYDPGADTFRAQDAVEQAIRMLEVARSIDRRLVLGEAEFSAEIAERAIVNTLGHHAHEKASLFSYFALATAREGGKVSNFDFRFGAARSVGEVDVEPITRRACETALGSLGAERGRSFSGQILLSPNAVHEILTALLLFQVSARNALRGMTRWGSAVGERVAAPTLSVIDDGRLPGGVATASFDREGVPHKKLALIEDGRLTSLLHNTYSAHALNTCNTGHAAGSAQSLPTIGPTNLSIPPGEVAKEDLLSEMRQGLLVRRFSGNVDPISGDFSGVAKAAHLVESGKLTRPVSGSLIAGNVFEALSTLSGVSNERERVFNFTLPYLRFERISVTADSTAR